MATKKKKQVYLFCPDCGSPHVWFAKSGNKIKFFDTYGPIKGIDFKPHECKKEKLPDNN